MDRPQGAAGEEQAMKKLVKILLIVLAVIVLGLIVGYLAIDSIAKTAIERGGSYALGVDTRVDSVSVGLFRGEIGIKGLVIGNPEGFKTPHLMKADRIDLGVRPGSLMGDVIEVSRFEIDGLDMNLEQKLGSTNVTAITQKAQGAGGDKAKDSKEPGGKKVKADRVVIRNVVAHVQVLPIGGNATTLDVKVPEIVLTDVGSDNAAGGATVSELMRKIVPAVLAAVVEKCKGAIPDADFKRLGDGVGKTLESLGAPIKSAPKLLEGIFGRKQPESPAKP
jgi:hypothetical protein